MRKRTREQQEQELEHIHTQSVGIVRIFATHHPEDREYQQAKRSAQKLLKLVEDRDRTDRCWYCHSTEDLGIERDTGLIQCLNCHSQWYGENLEYTRQIRDHLNEGYML